MCRNVMELFRFSAVGLSLFFFGLVTYYITLEILNFPLYPTFICVYLVATFLSFKLNAKFTFRKESNRKRAVQYYLVFGTGLLFATVLLYFLEHSLKVSNFLLVYLVMIPRIAFTYLLSKYIVFR